MYRTNKDKPSATLQGLAELKEKRPRHQSPSFLSCREVNRSPGTSFTSKPRGDATDLQLYASSQDYPPIGHFKAAGSSSFFDNVQKIMIGTCPLEAMEGA
jgi:hypothetical protein